MDEVTLINTGLTLFGSDSRQGASSMSFGKRSRLIDHGQEHQFDGIISLIGVRATTARGMAEKAVNKIEHWLGRRVNTSSTAYQPIFGGEIDELDTYLKQVDQSLSSKIPHKTLYALIRNYGSEYQTVLKYAPEDDRIPDTLGDSTTLKAEIVHAIHEEMACKLADVVFRRTDLGTGMDPGDMIIEECADMMSKELDWSHAQKENEIRDVRQKYSQMI
jgi:glycerol-3-phosphate dehydrogenase